MWVVDAPLFEPAAEATAAGDVAVGSAPGPPCTTPSPRRRTSTTFDTRPRRRAGLGLRHRLQRQRDRRRVDPYPPRGRPEAGLRGDGPRRGGGAGEVRLPARRLQVRRPAARRHRLRLGPDRARCSPARDSIRDVIAFPKSGGGFDPLTAAPAPITPEQRAEAGVDAPRKEPEPTEPAPSAERATTPALSTPAVLVGSLSRTVSASPRARCRHPAAARWAPTPTPRRRCRSGCGRAPSTSWSARSSCARRARRCGS